MRNGRLAHWDGRYGRLIGAACRVLSHDREGVVRQCHWLTHVALAQVIKMRYFITFTGYGARVHGDEPGTVDRYHNLFGGRTLGADALLAQAERRSMPEAAYEMDSQSRQIVLQVLTEVCVQRGWNLLAAHVRTNHVHVVVEAEVPPEKVMNDFKAYSSRVLNRVDGGRSGPRRWARHGSTRWLWKDQDVRQAIRYVVEQQGEPMAVFLGDVV